ncbi:hypothetical protein [Paraburkholderia bryophila]|uniref:Uncharacterized protein n=1 Tax=Paraburkholderia bryophila TaxID=420952 RepID=A0A329BKL0_9BURK|nr:hypothetical protein [Paraburkholderia bryophila]RAS19545.1 hypothetical protein BX591_14047 [Paraburkholderia bryophila]
MTSSTPEIDVAILFYDGMWNSENQKRLNAIGNELNKVRLYANEMVVDDLLSQTIIYLTGSAYFAGLVPIVRIESALFVEKEFRNEYAYALSVRAYIEVAGRLHKGMRLWRQYKSKVMSLEALRTGVERLMAKYRPSKNSSGGIFKGNGFNVMTFVESLEERIPDVADTYGDLSGYVHGGFEEQMLIRRESWFSDLKQDPNPIIESYEAFVRKLRDVAFDDFDELLQITNSLRERYDERHKREA